MPTKLIIVGLAIWLAGIAGTTAAVAQAGEVAVVVNPKNPITNVSTSELRKFLAGEKHAWSDGRPVKLFVRGPGTYERISFLKLLGMSETEYKQYWTEQVFRGEVQAEPIALLSNGMQKEAAATYPGALVLMGVNDIKPGMKVIKVDGHLPGEPGYSLQ